MSQNQKGFLSLKKLIGLIVVLAIAATLAMAMNGKSDKVSMDGFSLAEVRRGDLVIDVLEPGSLDAEESQEIECEVEGQTQIIYIVPEGTIISATDVLEEKVLVELDSSDLRDNEDRQSMSVQSASASYTDAKESYLIQLKQNESDLKGAELKVKFGLMDLEKYVGKELAQILVDGNVKNIPDLINHPGLGGEGLQQKKKLESDIDLADEDNLLADEKLNWTRRLAGKGYETEEKLKADELALKRSVIKQEQSKTDLELFKRYEFPKQVEKLYSDFQEAERELERTEAKCRSQLAKAEAKLMSAESQFKNEVDRLEKVQEQLKKCIIVATKPGLVVYDSDRYGNSRIAEGEMVRERQNIIKIPNTTAMIAKTNIHESVITKVKADQKAVVTVDAIPNIEFSGEVKKVALLPDSQNRWLNPNLKVFETVVTLDDNPPELKPEMSAQVQIIIDVLRDVVYIPVQAVTTLNQETFCYAMTPSGPEKRLLDVGQYNDKFMEVKSGLESGEEVVLNYAKLLPKGISQVAKVEDAKESDEDGEETRSESNTTNEEEQPKKKGRPDGASGGPRPR